MENGSFGVFPGRMALSDLFGPLTTPISALDFKDKIKITIKSNAGVKCLKVPKPCEIPASPVTDPAGGRTGRKPCEIPASPVTDPAGGRTDRKPCEIPASPATDPAGGRTDRKPCEIPASPATDPAGGRTGRKPCEIPASPATDPAGGRTDRKPCEIPASPATDPAGGRTDRKPCDVLKISLPSPGAVVEAGPYLKMSPFIESNWSEDPKAANMKEEALSCTGGRCSSTHNPSAHIKEEPPISAAAVGSPSTKTPNNEESLSGKGAPKVDRTQRAYKEECLQSANDKSSQEMSVHIKEEPLSDEEDLSDHVSLHTKREPVSGVDKSFYIKEEPFSDEDPNNIDETQIIPITIKEEAMSSEEESEEESFSHRAGGPSTSSRGTQTIWPSALRKDRILPRTLPLVIRNPQLTHRKMALPRETKTGLLKKVLELGTSTNDNAQEVRTLTCTPVKMYKCSKCGRYFTSRICLQRHYLAHKKYKVACPDCGRLFACKATVLRHQVVHSNQKPFPCSFCEKSFSSDKGREIHERRHTGDKPFICSDCGKNFLFKAQLETHQMVHTGERYSCHECGRCYRTKPGLVLHMRIHQGDVPYFCPECGKGFVQKSNLKNHLHTHSNDKPFTCLQCGKGFRQKYNLKQHMSVHVAKECHTYSCPECGKSYKRKADYRWHMLIHLGEK